MSMTTVRRGASSSSIETSLVIGGDPSINLTDLVSFV
jgi:hypothetical protein